jgi:hypothetical protein
MSKEIQLKNSDHYARQFKLPACIGNRKFAEQVKTIQKEAIDAYKVSNKNIDTFIHIY